MKIPFDIKYRPQIESGEYKVVTCDGHPARIICWDSPIDKDRPIIGIVYGDQIEQYKADGRYDNDYETSNYDLFLITPEPELSEFEKTVVDVIYAGCDIEVVLKSSSVKQHVREIASKLLDAARKEIIDGWSKELRDTQDFSGKAYNDGYQLGLEKGKDETFKYLPTWRESRAIRSTLPTIWYGDDGMILYKDGYEILISELDKLPKRAKYE